MLFILSLQVKILFKKLLLLTLLQMSPPPLFCPLLPTPAFPPPVLHYTVVSVHVSMHYTYMHICSLANFFQSPPTPPPLRFVSLFHVSMPLVFFYLPLYFVHLISHLVRSYGICLSLTGLFYLA